MCLAVTGRVIACDGEGVLRTAVVEVGDEQRAVTLAFAPEAHVGDWVLMHSGHAIAIVSQVEAREIVELTHDVTI